ncbi:MAG: alpha-L-fucosidase [Mobilitalea sp.]
MWIEGNYRRNLMDMHIDDWNEEFLSKIDCDAYVNVLKEAHVQAAMVKAKPHTGLCYYPTEIGRMHKGLKGKDFFGEMTEKCHANGIAVIAYFTQIFDNWAYDNHPAWRIVTEEGKNFREYTGGSEFKTGRYGIVCPNNEEYREYVKENLQYLNRNYKFEAMFLDMTFWPDLCYCDSCREKYRKETGRELPHSIDWDNAEFLEFQDIREKWMAEYAVFATSCIKEINPEVLIEHQFSKITSPWINGDSEYELPSIDYASGDYYGGFLQQTFINKYYKSISPNLPFAYHTSRCDPELVYHTTTKTENELLLNVITALVHNGAFLLVDALNPDGTFVPKVYTDLMKKVYENTMQYEKYVSGDLLHDVEIWFATHSKFDPNDTNIPMSERTFHTKYYIDAPVQLASIMRDYNIPYDVIGSVNLNRSNSKLLALPHVSRIMDEEMADIENYITNGGTLYVSGPIGHERLQELLGVKVKGRTNSNFTYMSPTAEGEKFLEGFTRTEPLTLSMHQYRVEITDPDCTVLATMTLPYVDSDQFEFSAIHSNPPGIYTEEPSIILKNIGKGRILWTSAPIELMRPFMSRRVINNFFLNLIGQPKYQSNAPKEVEIIGWTKENHTYFAAINQQERPPIVPMHDITIDVPGDNRKAVMLPDGQQLETSAIDHNTRIYLPKLEVFQIVEVYGGD